MLLLDEIEKAHPDVFNILLQILEDGRLTDSQGRTVDFRHAIVIMTSNIGASEIARNTPLGFAVSDDETGHLLRRHEERGSWASSRRSSGPSSSTASTTSSSSTSSRRTRSSTIVDLLLRRIRASLAERDLQLELTEGAEDFLVEKGWDPAMGARPLRRAIQRYIEDPLADFVLRAELVPGGDRHGRAGARGLRRGGQALDRQAREAGARPVGGGGKDGGADEAVDDGGALDQPAVPPPDESLTRLSAGGAHGRPREVSEQRGANRSRAASPCRRRASRRRP